MHKRLFLGRHLLSYNGQYSCFLHEPRWSMLRVIIITMRMELVQNMDNNQSLGTNAKKIRLIRVATIIKKKETEYVFMRCG